MARSLRSGTDPEDLAFGGGAFSNANGSNKIRLHLSRCAVERLDQDAERYHTRFGPLVNRIFLSFREDADASVAAALARCRAHWETLLFAPTPELRTISRANRQQILRLLLADEAERLRRKAFSYPEEEMRQVYLWSENYEYLTSPASDCREDMFYRDKSGAAPGIDWESESGSNHMAWYVRAVLEEYARKPRLEREGIYYSALLERIGGAVRAEKQLAIRTAAGRVFHLAPFEVVTDHADACRYLVGLEVPIAAISARGCTRCVSYPLSRLEDAKVQVLRSRSGRLTRAQRQRAAAALERLGPQGLASGEAEEPIVLRLTQTGRQCYRAQPHLRPAGVYDAETDTYAFFCSGEEIRRYFFPFGAEVEIVSPPALRFAFAQEYQRALQQYV